MDLLLLPPIITVGGVGELAFLNNCCNHTNYTTNVNISPNQGITFIYHDQSHESYSKCQK